MDNNQSPPKNSMITMCKAMLAFLPESSIRTLLPMLHWMEMRELIKRFQWEDAQYLRLSHRQEPMTLERVAAAMKESMGPEAAAQFDSMMQMFDMMSAMQGSEQASEFDFDFSPEDDPDDPFSPSHNGADS